jgi:hypothetical protein
MVLAELALIPSLNIDAVILFQKLEYYNVYYRLYIYMLARDTKGNSLTITRYKRK